MGATGTATINFGAFPGASDTSVAVTGQTGILSGSFVEAWIMPATSADHSIDEHLVEQLKVVAGNISAGVGFTIYGLCTCQVNEPTTPVRTSRFAGAGVDSGPGKQDNQNTDSGGKSPRLYGQWTVAWVWN